MSTEYSTEALKNVGDLLFRAGDLLKRYSDYYSSETGMPIEAVDDLLEEIERTMKESQ